MKFENQREMFLYIWENREHVSQISGKQLLNINNPQWHWQFLHVLPKGTYPKYKLNPDNIILGTVSEHENQEHFKFFREKQLKLTQEYYKKFYNKKYD